MVDDPLAPLPPAPAPLDSPAPPRRDHYITCGFCECRLMPSGDAMRLSDKARAYRDQEEERARDQKKIGELETKIRELEAKIAELNPSPRERQRLFGGR